MSAVNPQADIEAIEARKEPTEADWTSLPDPVRAPLVAELRYWWHRALDAEAARDEAVLEVRQLRQALAAVENRLNELGTWAENELITDDGFARACVFSTLRDIRAALGAAGSQGQSGENPKDTPTPQECDGSCGCLLRRSAICDWPPVTSTPEAATERRWSGSSSGTGRRTRTATATTATS